MAFPTAPLGKNGPQVTRVGFGLMGLSAFYGATKPDHERLAVLDEAYSMLSPASKVPMKHAI